MIWARSRVRNRVKVRANTRKSCGSAAQQMVLTLTLTLVLTLDLAQITKLPLLNYLCSLLILLKIAIFKKKSRFFECGVLWGTGFLDKIIVFSMFFNDVYCFFVIFLTVGIMV